MTQPTSSAHPPPLVTAGSRTELRKFLLQQRGAIDPLRRQAWDARIAQRVLAWCRQHQLTSLGVYWPIQGEPDLLDCYQQLSELGLQLALPLVSGKHRPLHFLAWQPGDAMTTDEYGIPVPAQRERRLNPAALLIPCVGFNAQGYRLGYGGGYYDCTLALAPRPLALGVAYQLLRAEFAPGAHDIALDSILTEEG